MQMVVTHAKQIVQNGDFIMDSTTVITVEQVDQVVRTTQLKKLQKEQLPPKELLQERPLQLQHLLQPLPPK